mmetsp:Transcript_6093/g.23080  ORF Transcript_6093/g.23080 Transcript_6093/m.23080 type:complete len:568 (-) Transcript_6093:56-1759(-)
MPINPKIKSLQSSTTLCADCHTPSPSWASTNLAVFLCLNCAGVHRKMGVHISKVRSVTLDEWDDKVVNAFLEKWYAREGLPAQSRMTREAMNNVRSREQFIRNKWDEDYARQHATTSWSASSAHHQQGTSSRNGSASSVQGLHHPNSSFDNLSDDHEIHHDISISLDDDDNQDIFKIDVLTNFHVSERLQYACEAPFSEKNALVAQGRGIYEWHLTDLENDDDDVEKEVLVKDLPAPSQISKFEKYSLIAYPIYTDMIELFHMEHGSRVYTIRRESLTRADANNQSMPILNTFDLLCKVSDSIMAVSSSSGVVVLSIKSTLQGEAPKVLTYNSISAIENHTLDPIHILDALSDERIVIACGDYLYAWDWISQIDSQQTQTQSLWGSLWNKNTTVTGFFDSVRRNVSTFIENNVSSVPFATCLKAGERVTSFKALPDERFVVGTKNGRLLIYSNDGLQLFYIGSHDMLIRDMIFVGRYTLVTASRDFIRVWDFVHTGKYVQIPLAVDVQQLLYLKNSDSIFYVITEHHVFKYGITRTKSLAELGQEFSMRVQLHEQRDGISHSGRVER